MKDTLVTFKEWTGRLVKHTYLNRRLALELIDVEEGDSIAMCTVNVPEYDLPDGYVIIKDYAENDGMLEALITANVVEHPVAFVLTGFVKVPVCKLLI